MVEGEVTPRGRHGYRYPKADVTQSRLRTGASQRWRLTSMLPS
jgi:hypothetical protein